MHTKLPASDGGAPTRVHARTMPPVMMAVSSFNPLPRLMDIRALPPSNGVVCLSAGGFTAARALQASVPRLICPHSRRGGQSLLLYSQASAGRVGGAAVITCVRCTGIRGGAHQGLGRSIRGAVCATCPARVSTARARGSCVGARARASHILQRCGPVRLLAVRLLGCQCGCQRLHIPAAVLPASRLRVLTNALSRNSACCRRSWGLQGLGLQVPT